MKIFILLLQILSWDKIFPRACVGPISRIMIHPKKRIKKVPHAFFIIIIIFIKKYPPPFLLQLNNADEHQKWISQFHVRILIDDDVSI